MKKKIFSLAMAAVMAVSLVACGGGNNNNSASNSIPSTSTSSKSEAPTDNGGEGEVLEFYHGYYHAESEWPAAKVMRDIYDEFAAAHADGPVKFVPTAVENGAEIAQSMIAGGSFPNIIDYAGSDVPLAAISGGLVLDLKPYIDANGLKDAVGINYTQNDVDGKIYSVHDQLLTMGMWYNKDVLESAGMTVDDIATWDGFASVIDKVSGDNYAYIGGQSSVRFLLAKLASAGATDIIGAELSAESVSSDVFATAFKEVAAMDQKNGSDHTVNDVGQLMAEFNANGKVAMLQNGVWNASGIDDAIIDSIFPCNLPGDVSINQAGGGITIASGMSEAQEALALEFLAYMVSPEVQAKIFTGVQANPCNTTVDLEALAASSGDPKVAKLAEACAKANSAKTISTNVKWGGDTTGAIINAFMEASASGADINAIYEKLVAEITALVG